MVNRSKKKDDLSKSKVRMMENVVRLIENVVRLIENMVRLIGTDAYILLKRARCKVLPFATCP